MKIMGNVYIQWSQVSTKKGITPQIHLFLNKKGNPEHLDINAKTLVFKTEKEATKWLLTEIANELQKNGSVWDFVPIMEPFAPRTWVSFSEKGFKQTLAIVRRVVD